MASGLPELDVARIRRWCDERVPAHVRDQVQVGCEVATRYVTVVERRPPWREDYGPQWSCRPVARLRYTKATGVWTLYYTDRNLRFPRYDAAPATVHVVDLLAEIDRDPSLVDAERRSAAACRSCTEKSSVMADHPYRSHSVRSSLRGMGQRADLAILWTALLLMALPATAAAAVVTETGRVGVYSLGVIEVGSGVLMLVVLAVAVVVAAGATVAISRGAANRS